MYSLPYGATVAFNASESSQFSTVFALEFVSFQNYVISDVAWGGEFNRLTPLSGVQADENKSQKFTQVESQSDLVQCISAPNPPDISSHRFDEILIKAFRQRLRAGLRFNYSIAKLGLKTKSIFLIYFICLIIIMYVCQHKPVYI